MNALQFFRLLRTIYSPQGPDLDLIQKLGLLAIKIGQTYALRFDFLPEDNCRQLSRLYQHVDAVPAALVERIMREAYGDGWRDHFRLIEANPLASASVGQVHRAELRDGQQVVVKVVKDDFAAAFKRDVAAVRRLVEVAIFFYRKLERVADPVGILNAIEENTLAELDLLLEIEGQRTLRDIKGSHGQRFDLDILAFPHIHTELSNSRVMVSEELFGPTFDDLLNRGELAYQTLLDLYRVHGFYIFGVGTFHGDIHPGNLILQDDKIYMIDTGAIGRVSRRLGRGLLFFFEALSEYDYGAAAQTLNSMADEKIDGAKYRRFREHFCHLYADFREANVSEVSLTKKMMQTIKLGVHSGMRFEPGMYPVIKSLMYLDGMVLRCNPSAKPIRDMRPVIDILKQPLVEPERTARVSPTQRQAPLGPGAKTLTRGFG